MKTKHLLAAAVALCVALGGALPGTVLHAADAGPGKKDFKKRVLNPAVDYVNTLGASIERVYMERTFCMINFLLPPDKDPTAASGDFFIEVPSTGKIYNTRKTGGSHIVASRLLNSGQLYLGITFEGIPEGTPLINVYLPATSTRFTGVRLDGSPAQSRGQQPDTPAGRLPAQEAESVEPAGEGVTVEPITGAPRQGTPAKPKTTEKQTPATPADAATPKKETPFTSPDLSFYDLVGRVKSCTILNEDNTCREVILFDKQGHVMNTDNKNLEKDYIVKRDGRGYITQLIDREPSYDDGHDVTTYSWTPGGKLLKMIWESSEGESTTIYTYDRFGALVKERTQGFQGDTVDETTTYEYLKIESHERPNWTERRVTRTSGTHRQQWTERRTITYYE